MKALVGREDAQLISPSGAVNEPVARKHVESFTNAALLLLDKLYKES